VEDHSAQIDQVLAAGEPTLDDTVERDGRRAWATAAAFRDPLGSLPRLLFQQVPEPKIAKNRWHLDVHVEAGTP